MNDEWHLDEDDVIAAAAAGDAATRHADHLRRCRACGERVADAATVRHFVTETGGDAPAPSGLATRTVAMIRAKAAAVESLNETVDSLASVGRSFAHFVFGRRS